MEIRIKSNLRQQEIKIKIKIKLRINRTDDGSFFFKVITCNKNYYLSSLIIHEIGMKKLSTERGRN